MSPDQATPLATPPAHACSGCGAQTSSDASFCRQCGTAQHTVTGGRDTAPGGDAQLDAAPWVQQPPTGSYPQAQQTPPAGYGTPVYGSPPPPPPAPAAPQGGGGAQRGLIIALAGLIALLLLGGGVAVLVLVSSSDKATKPVPPPAVVAAQPQRTPGTKLPAHAKSTPTRSPHRSPAPKRSPAGQVTAPSRPKSASTPASVDRQSIESMMSRHFANIQAGNYSAAFADLAASLGQSQSGWTSELRSDGLYSHSLAVAPQLSSPTTAVANIVNFHTEAEASGCKDWSGSWNVVKAGGRWQISKSNLSQTVVNCGE